MHQDHIPKRGWPAWSKGTNLDRPNRNWTKYQGTQDCMGLRLEIRVYCLRFRDVENKEGMIKGTENIQENPRFVLFCFPWGRLFIFYLPRGMSFFFSMTLVFG